MTSTLVMPIRANNMPMTLTGLTTLTPSFIQKTGKICILMNFSMDGILF